jgi:Lipocalin-like domain
MPSLVGVWRLVCVRTRDEAGRLLHTADGDDVIGVAAFTGAGRMTAAVARTGPDDGGPRFAAYHGSYSVDGMTLTTKVEDAVNPAWVGSEQVRETRFDGADRVFLRPPQRQFGDQLVRLELEWVRSTERGTASD